MNWAHENADRNFSAGPAPDTRMTSLRDLLKTSEVADYFDEMARMRIGAASGREVFGSSCTPAILLGPSSHVC
jgi:hypothetical protein